MDPVEVRQGVRLAAVAIVCAITTAALTIGVGRQFLKQEAPPSPPSTLVVAQTSLN